MLATPLLRAGHVQEAGSQPCCCLCWAEPLPFPVSARRFVNLTESRGSELGHCMNPLCGLRYWHLFPTPPSTSQPRLGVRRFTPVPTLPTWRQRRGHGGRLGPARHLTNKPGGTFVLSWGIPRVLSSVLGKGQSPSLYYLFHIAVSRRPRDTRCVPGSETARVRVPGRGTCSEKFTMCLRLPRRLARVVWVSRQVFSLLRSGLQVVAQSVCG